MKKILINLSNHPFKTWGEKQKEAAKKYGDVIDIPFPDIDPDAERLDQLVDDYFHKITDYTAPDTDVSLHIMGEMTFVYQLVYNLQEWSFIKCIASTTRRIVTMGPDGVKKSVFEFVRFREY